MDEDVSCRKRWDVRVRARCVRYIEDGNRERAEMKHQTTGVARAYILDEEAYRESEEFLPCKGGLAREDTI